MVDKKCVMCYTVGSQTRAVTRPFVEVFTQILGFEMLKN